MVDVKSMLSGVLKGRSQGVIAVVLALCAAALGLAPLGIAKLELTPDQLDNVTAGTVGIASVVIACAVGLLLGGKKSAVLMFALCLGGCLGPAVHQNVLALDEAFEKLEENSRPVEGVSTGARDELVGAVRRSLSELEESTR